MTSKETAAAEIDLEIKVEISKYAANYFLGMKENESSVVQAIMDAAYHWYQKGASLQPKEADKDIEIEERERESKFLNERINEQYREIERLKAALDACFGVMMQFTSIGKGKFYTPHKLEIILAERKRAETLYYEAQKPLTDKDIQSKWISVEAVKELLAKQRVLCAEYLEDSFSEHPYKLHQMINYAPEPPLPNRDQNVQECDASKAPSMREPMANNSPKDEGIEKLAEEYYEGYVMYERNYVSGTLRKSIIAAMIEMYNAAKTTK
jgi:hypothetical protein